jgi:hypothetical protein
MNGKHIVTEKRCKEIHKKEKKTRGLADYAEHVKACYGPGIFGSLALCVIKIGRNGDYGLVDWSKISKHELSISVDI